jgi:hypothetical protein
MAAPFVFLDNDDEMAKSGLTSTEPHDGIEHLSRRSGKLPAHRRRTAPNKGPVQALLGHPAKSRLWRKSSAFLPTPDFQLLTSDF